MIQAPLVAVVVPVHNAAPWLDACLDTIAAQTFSDFVCILVDDGSTDESGALCESRAADDPRFHVLHQRACGAAAARAAGVKAAQDRGVTWIAFCDADDLYTNDLLQLLLGAVRETGQLLSCCRYTDFSNDETPSTTVPHRTVTPKVLASPKHLDALLHDHAVDYSLCNKLYHTSLLTPELLNNGLAANEDLLANWQIFMKTDGLAFLDVVGYYYRQHAASSSHRVLGPASVDEQRTAALYIREHATPEMQQSADAFYYEKLVYLASMILRRDDAADYRVQLNELGVGITAGLKDKRLGRNPRLPLSIRMAAWATVRCPSLWYKICQQYLTDRR